MNKVALITGITGQDGAYLAEFLLEKGYEVHGIRRRTSLFNTERIEHLYEKFRVKEKKLFLHYGDLTDSSNLISILRQTRPHEIYNLAAMSHVKISFDMPEYVANVDGLGTLRLLEAIRILGLEKRTKIYQASTSELYGKVQQIPQNEATPFYPRSPYAVAKIYAYWITVNYREAYNIHASNGILFNHESPIRGKNFVTRKITGGVVDIVKGKSKVLKLGNLNAERDWGHAKDFVKGMYLILQQDQPGDYVLATGVTTQVREFVDRAFKYVGITIKFHGSGVNEYASIEEIDGNYPHLNQGDIVVQVDSNYFRPTEVDLLLGDASKARTILGWSPEHTLDELIGEMIEKDLNT